MNYIAINTAVKIEALLSVNVRTDEKVFTAVCPTKNSLGVQSSAKSSLHNKTAEKLKEDIEPINPTSSDIQIINGDYYFSSSEKSVAGSTLLDKIDQMLDMARISLKDLDFLACVVGPGSFTGIRIGVSAVRAIAYALDKPIIPVTYFDMCAYNNSMPFTAAVDGGCGVCYIKNYPSSHINIVKTPPKIGDLPFNIVDSLQNTACLPLNNMSPDSIDDLLINSNDSCLNLETEQVLCIKIEDLKQFSHEKIVGDSFFSESIMHTISDGHMPLKWATESAANRKAFIAFENLSPLYLRRSQPERGQGEL